MFNIRRRRFEARSENQENELLSLVIIKVSIVYRVSLSRAYSYSSYMLM